MYIKKGEKRERNICLRERERERERVCIKLYILKSLRSQNATTGS